MTDHAGEQAMEIEALEAILMDDLQVCVAWWHAYPMQMGAHMDNTQGPCVACHPAAHG